MKFSGFCIMVEDMARAKRFYTEALSQRIVMDMDQNVTFDGSFSLQSEYDRLMGIARADFCENLAAGVRRSGVSERLKAIAVRTVPMALRI